MPKFTPGPWKADVRVGCVAVYPTSTSREQSNCLDGANAWAIHLKQGRYIPESEWGLDTETVANAVLIVAAPKLFEACRTIINTFEGKSGLSLPEHFALDSAVEAVEAVVGELHDHSREGNK